MFPLKYLFGFTEYNKILYLIKIRLELNLKTESEINSNIFYGSAGTTGKLKFNKVELHIPHITPSYDVEKKVLARLNTGKPIDVVFFKRSMNSKTIDTGESSSWSLGSYTNSVRFVYVVFKNQDISIEKNNSLFTGSKIKSLKLQLNGMYYPISGMKFNFEENNIAEPYYAYIQACKTQGVEPQLSLLDFLLYPIFCFDTSAQPESLKSHGINLTLKIEKDSTVKLEGFALILEDSYFKIDVGNGTMLRIS